MTKFNKYLLQLLEVARIVGHKTIVIVVVGNKVSPILIYNISSLIDHPKI
jgi:hypothetical protein